MDKLELEDRVYVIGKNTYGKIAYIGKTHFSEGDWFGVILDEAKGRNNGCIGGERYFQCPRNCGLFVRRCQLQREIIKDDAEKVISLPKVIYPNYLGSSAPVKSQGSQDEKKTGGKVKTEIKTCEPQIHPMKPVIGDLENILKKQSEELIKLQDQKTIAEQELKIKEKEVRNLTEDMDKMKHLFKKRLANAQKDVGTLKRKLLKSEKHLDISERKRHMLDIKIEELREITETAVIEKEIAEEKSEFFELIANDKAEKYNTLKIEMDTLKEEMQLQIINGIPSVHYVKRLENKNEVLNSALLKLRDLYRSLQKQIYEFDIAAKQDRKEIEDRKIAEKTLERVVCKYKEEVTEMGDMINNMLYADEIVFEVTERNLKSEAKIDCLYQELHDAENLLEVSEEIEENLQEIKLMCGEEIECLKSKVRSTQLTLEAKNLFLKDHVEIINKYRELTAVLREKNNKVSAELEKVSKERKEAVIAAENLKLKFHREGRKSMHDLMKIEILKIDLESFENELSYWSAFMHENFFMHGQENSAIQVRLLTTKMMKKIDLLIYLLHLPYRNSSNAVQWEQLRCLSTETKFLIAACELQGFLKIFNMSFDHTDAKYFLILGKHYEVVSQKNKELDNYLNLVTNGEIDRQINIESLKNVHSSLSQLLNIKCAPKSEGTMVHLECSLKKIQISIKCILRFSIALNDLDNFPAECKIHIKQVIETTKKLNMNVNSIFKTVLDCEKENLNLLSIVEEKLNSTWNFIQQLMEYMTFSYETFSDENQEFDNLWKPDSATFNEMSHKLMKAETELDELRKQLSRGEFFIECNSLTQSLSPICTYAQHKKQETELIIADLRNKIASYELELANLTQVLLMQKKQLDEKIHNKLLKDASQQTDEQGIEFSLNAGDSLHNMIDYLKFQLQDQECAMKYLSQKNFELKMASMRFHQKSLQSLTITPKPKYHVDTHRLYILQKRLNDAAIKLRSIILPTVVDITTRNSCKEKKFKEYLLERMFVYNEVKDEIWNVMNEIRRLRASPRCIWSNTNN